MRGIGAWIEGTVVVVVVEMPGAAGSCPALDKKFAKTPKSNPSLKDKQTAEHQELFCSQTQHSYILQVCR